MAEHTPGPWKAAKSKFGRRGDEYSVTNDEIGDASGYIASVVGAGNAHLIAAAPDLLAALEEIAESPAGAYSRDRVQYRDNVIADMQEKARAAIAKAKGVAV